MGFEGSYIWQVRQHVGRMLLLVPGAGILVEDAAGRILLMKRKDTPQWCTPGGSAEAGSSFLQTAIDELGEETGLIAEAADLVPFATVSRADWHTLTYPNGDEVQAFSVWFLLKRWSGELRLDPEEAVDVQFFPRDRLPEPLFKPSAAALHLYQRYLDTGRFQPG